MYEIAWQFIDEQIKLQKIDIKAECKKRGISYGNFCRIIREHNNNIKVSNLIIIADILKVDIADLFRKER
ncbi:MAG: hypothetical protein SOZ04_06050 [Bacilli bacterium]|nr:hypothetical protein [Bacilli bacterium]